MNKINDNFALSLAFQRYKQSLVVYDPVQSDKEGNHIIKISLGMGMSHKIQELVEEQFSFNDHILFVVTTSQQSTYANDRFVFQAFNAYFNGGTTALFFGHMRHDLVPPQQILEVLDMDSSLSGYDVEQFLNKSGQNKHYLDYKDYKPITEGFNTFYSNSNPYYKFKNKIIENDKSKLKYEEALDALSDK